MEGVHPHFILTFLSLPLSFSLRVLGARNPFYQHPQNTASQPRSLFRWGLGEGDARYFIFTRNQGKGSGDAW